MADPVAVAVHVDGNATVVVIESVTYIPGLYRTDHVHGGGHLHVHGHDHGGGHDHDLATITGSARGFDRRC